MSIEQGIAFVVLAAEALVLVGLLLWWRRGRSVRTNEVSALRDELKELLEQASVTQERVEQSLARADETLRRLGEAQEETATACGGAVMPDPAGAERIRHLARSGMDSVRIARELGRPVGEVELVLNMQRNGHGA